jgi:predicted glycosyl hydrolase (DUF1957 family)
MKANAIALSYICIILVDNKTQKHNTKFTLTLKMEPNIICRIELFLTNSRSYISLSKIVIKTEIIIPFLY